MLPADGVGRTASLVIVAPAATSGTTSRADMTVLGLAPGCGLYLWLPETTLLRRLKPRVFPGRPGRRRVTHLLIPLASPRRIVGVWARGVGASSHRLELRPSPMCGTPDCHRDQAHKEEVPLDLSPDPRPPWCPSFVGPPSVVSGSASLRSDGSRGYAPTPRAHEAEWPLATVLFRCRFAAQGRRGKGELACQCWRRCR